MPRTSGGDAYTLTTAAVVASSAATAATASFAGGDTSPVVGTAVTVSPLPTHSDRTLWRWQRCTASDGTGTCTLLAPGEPSWSYTPVAADVGNYLRAFVYNSSGRLDAGVDARRDGLHRRGRLELRARGAAHSSP